MRVRRSPHSSPFFNLLILSAGILLSSPCQAAPCWLQLASFTGQTAVGEVSRFMSELGLENEFRSLPDRKRKRVLNSWKFWLRKNPVSPAQIDSLAFTIMNQIYGKDYSLWLSLRQSKGELENRMRHFWDHYESLRRNLEVLAVKEGLQVRVRLRDRIAKGSASRPFQFAITLISNTSSLWYLGMFSYLPRFGIESSSSVRSRFLTYQYQKFRYGFFLSLLLSAGASSWIVGDAHLEAQSLEQYLATQRRLTSQLQMQKDPRSKAEQPTSSAMKDLYRAWLEDFKIRNGREPTSEDEEYILMQQLRTQP